jgi:hypothetical protein
MSPADWCKLKSFKSAWQAVVCWARLVRVLRMNPLRLRNHNRLRNRLRARARAHRLVLRRPLVRKEPELAAKQGLRNAGAPAVRRAATQRGCENPSQRRQRCALGRTWRRGSAAVG